MPSLLALNTPNVGLFPPLFAAAKTSSTVGDMLEDGDLKPAAVNEDSDSDFDNYEDGDLKLAALNEESDSDYDNDEDGDLKTGPRSSRRKFLVVHSALDMNHLVSFEIS